MPADRRGGSPPESARPCFVLAVDFGGSKTMVAAVDLHGQILATERLPVGDASGSEGILEGAVRAGRRLVEATTCGHCVGAGVATAGIPTAEGILLSPNLPGWDRVRLAERIGDALGIGPVLVGNDVKCAALAEHRWGALRGADPALYLNLGSGVSAAIVVGGRVLHGAHGGAGEIGYAAGRIPETAHEPSTLEDMVGGRRIAERASRLAGRRLTTSQVFDAAGAELRQVVTDGLETLAAHLRTVVLALDPARVALGGGLMGHAARVLDALRRGVAVPEPLGAEVVAGQFLDDAALRGAAALALDAVLGGAGASALDAVRGGAGG